MWRTAGIVIVTAALTVAGSCARPDDGAARRWSSDDVRRLLTPAVEPTNPSALRLDALGKHLIDADAAMRLGRIALAACEHRRLHGMWPASTDELAPLFPDGVPGDPFTGTPVVVWRAGDHLTLRAPRWDCLPRDEDIPRAPGDDGRLPPR